MAQIPIFDHRTVLAAMSPAQAIEAVREGFRRFALGEWTMPPKIYVDSPPNGDFRAMPARGDGLAILKWVTSFPRNPERGLPTVTGTVLVSDADTGEPAAIVDARGVTALRTGAAAAIAARELAAPGARTVGAIGCGVHGAWAARCLAVAGYGPGRCFDPNQSAAEALSAELGWQLADRTRAAACDIVCTTTPGDEPVLDADDLRPGQHLNMLGADVAGKAEATLDVIARCQLFCDEWEQASHGGELTGAVEAGRVRGEDVTELGDVIAGKAPGRIDAEATTLFDSTGLAIQDLAVCKALLERWRSGDVQAQVVVL